MEIFRTEFKGNPIIFYDDHFTYKGAQVHYDEISNISYRDSEPPLVMFHYRGRHLGIPYVREDGQIVVELFEKIRMHNNLSVTQKFDPFTDDDFDNFNDAFPKDNNFAKASQKSTGAGEIQYEEVKLSSDEKPAKKKSKKTAVIVTVVCIIGAALLAVGAVTLYNLLVSTL